LFATRTAPALALLLDRTLPIESRVVESRAAAVHASEEAFAATRDAYDPGSVGAIRTVLYAKKHRQQREAMIAAVCRYNRDIADYALAVSNPSTDGKALVRMLIKVAAKPLRPVVSPVDGQVQHAGLDEPIRRPPPRRRSPRRRRTTTSRASWIPSRVPGSTTRSSALRRTSRTSPETRRLPPWRSRPVPPLPPGQTPHQRT
jgi:hypothetical protein